MNPPGRDMKKIPRPLYHVHFNVICSYSRHKLSHRKATHVQNFAAWLIIGTWDMALSFSSNGIPSLCVTSQTRRPCDVTDNTGSSHGQGQPGGVQSEFGGAGVWGSPAAWGPFARSTTFLGAFCNAFLQILCENLSYNVKFYDVQIVVSESVHLWRR